jgi:hypothetical protein
MEITVNSLIIGIGLFAIILLILGLAGRKLGEMYFKLEQERERKELQFETLFMRGQFILSLESTEKRMNELLILISQLEKWSNKEKVNMIKTRFFTDYKKLSDELLSENEYSVEETFRKN